MSGEEIAAMRKEIATLRWAVAKLSRVLRHVDDVFLETWEPHVTWRLDGIDQRLGVPKSTDEPRWYGKGDPPWDDDLEVEP